MAGMNPLIVKELLQASHRRRTYALRAGVPALAIAIISFAVANVVVRVGQDWRSVADVARPIFEITAWLQLIVFGILSLSYATEALQLEWTRRTMELLCATPISHRAIVFGKFAAVLLRILMVWLALLPVMAIWLSLGHIPAGLALGSMAAIAASTMMCAAMPLLLSSFYRPGRSGWGMHYLLFLVPLAAFVAALIRWHDHPLLVAAIPPWSFAYVMNDACPEQMMTSMSFLFSPPTWFAILAAAEPFAIAALALLAAPWFFRRSFQRYESGDSTRGWRKALTGWQRRKFGRRPPLGTRQNPLEWQESGASTASLRWSAWVTYLAFAGLVVIVFLFAERVDLRDIFRGLGEPGLYLTLSGIVAAVMTFSAGVYGANVFAREKERRTVEALLLTGNAPAAFYRAKLTAAYKALRWPLASVAALLVAAAGIMAGQSDFSGLALAWISAACLIGPGLAAVIGMAFGAAAKSRGEAVGAIIGAGVFAAALNMPIYVITFLLLPRAGDLAHLGVMAVVGLLAICAVPTRWTPLRLSLVMAGTLLLVFALVGALATADLRPDSAAFLAICVAIALATDLFWYRLGVRIFDRCMLNLADRPGKK